MPPQSFTVPTPTLPYTNATLTQVRGEDIPENYSQPAVQGPVQWTGQQPIYVADELHESDNGSTVDLVRITRLEVPWAVGSLADQGDIVTYTFGGQTFVRRVNEKVGDPIVDRVRLSLQNA